MIGATDKAIQVISNKEELTEIIHKAKICHIAMVDHGKPYVLGFCFGFEDDTVYLHTAKQGKKLDVLRQNPEVCIAFDVDHEIFSRHEQVACSWRMRYRSVLVFGRVKFIEDDEQKIHGLNMMMKHYANKEFSYSKPSVDNILVLSVKAEKITGRKFEMM